MHVYLSLGVALLLIAQPLSGQQQRTTQGQQSQRTTTAGGEENKTPTGTGHDCGTIPELPTLPFLTIAEYDGTRNWSLEDRKEPGRLSADDDSILILCVDPQALARHRTYANSNISFEAKIGSRPIEVQGYTEVGKQTGVVLAGLRSTSVPELRTFMRRVRAVKSDDTPAELLEKSRLVLQSLTVATATNDVAAGTTEVLQTSSSDLAGKREDLSSSILTATTAGAQRDTLQAQRSRANREVDEAEAALEQARTAVKDAERDRDRLVDRVNTLSAQAAPDPALPAAQQALAEARTLLATRQQVAVGGEDAVREKRARLAEIERDLIRQDETFRNAMDRIRTVVDDLSTLFPAQEDQLRTIVTLASDVPNGFINLKTQDAKSGDVLYINLRIYSNSSQDTYRTVPVANIYIRDYGFVTNISPSFMLVKRSTEPDVTTDTSNFKGAAGVSLLFSHRARPFQKAWTAFNGLSAGINVSYLDFDTTQNLEIGAGPVFGFFKDRVHAGVGWNLNVSDSRFYYYVGFGFANIQRQNNGNDATQTPATP